jgi:hypothetical protein
LKGYAGCGKSTLAKRLAVDAASLLDRPLVVYLPEGAVLRAELLLELQRLVKDRLYVFIDDLMEYAQELPDFLVELKSKCIPITIFGCARTNELYGMPQVYSKAVSASFELGDLEEDEIVALLGKLNEHKLLGPLGEYAESERGLLIERFYGRQLLVTLHEITRGAPFEQIIVDEYENIIARDSQQLYLDICTLHQCNVGARAGLLSRLNGISIDDLQTHLSGALKSVIRVVYGHRYRDLIYTSRHDEIARMVFGLGISSAATRAEQLTRILARMDLDYSSDRKAFFELVRGRRLAAEFEDRSLALMVFEAAERAGPPQSFLLHQKAVFELSHKNGSLESAAALLREAEQQAALEKYPPASIQHTKANLLRKRANSSATRLERERYRAEARNLLRRQPEQRSSLYSENLLGNLLLDELKDALSANSAPIKKAGLAVSEDPRLGLLKRLDELIDEGLRRVPDDGPMTLLKSEVQKIVGDTPEAIDILRTHCRGKDPNSRVVKVLGEVLVQSNQALEAIALLRPAVISNPSDKELNFAIAKALLADNEWNHAQAILSHLRRSFSDGDSRYEARILYARCQLLHGDVEKGKAEFALLKRARLQTADPARYFVTGKDGSVSRLQGWIANKKYEYAFLASNDLRFGVHLSRGKAIEGLWHKLERGQAVSFLLGFSLRGPIPVSVQA